MAWWSKGFKVTNLCKWAEHLVKHIPYIDPHDCETRRVLFFINAPFTVRCRIKGVWGCWILAALGISVDLFVLDDRGTNTGAVLFRDYFGVFNLAATFITKDVNSLEDIFTFIEYGLNLAAYNGIQVAGVQCSQFHMFYMNASSGTFKPLQVAPFCKKT